MDEDLANDIVKRFDFLTPRESGDCLSFDCPQDVLLRLCESLRDKEGFELLVDLTAVDWGEQSSPRFSTFHHFYSLARNSYLRIASHCLHDENPEAPSVVSVYPAADWHEREVFDMFGIRFSGHPNLKRILMWDEYEHFPLRKDFPLAGVESDLPASDVEHATGVGVIAAPMEGGPFVAPPEGHASQSEPRGKDQAWTEKREKPS